MRGPDRTSVLRGRIAHGERLLAQLDEEHGHSMAALAVAAAELEELLETHMFLVVTAAALPPLSLEEWRALDLIERCAEARQQTRQQIDVCLLEMRLNRAQHTEYVRGIEAMRAELAALEDQAPAPASTGTGSVLRN